MSAGDRPQTLPIVLLILTGLTGVVDAESFLSFGHVFTANMTGNVVFIAFALAGVQGLSVARSGTAFFGFLGGVTLRSHGTRDRTQRVAGGSSGAPLRGDRTDGSCDGRSERDGAQDWRARFCAERAHDRIDWNRRQLIARGHNPVWTRRVVSVVTMFAGALFGAWLWHLSTVWPLMVACVVSAVCGLAISGDGHLAVAP